MSEWKEYKLGDFMEFNPKNSLPKSTMARKIAMDQLIPHTRDIYSWTYEPYSGGAKFQNGDTIMARITPCLENGKHAFISLLDDNEIAYGSTEFIVIRGRKGISDSLFVYYLSKFPSFKAAAIKSMVGSSGRQRAQVDVLENLTMMLPALPEQTLITSILSSLDDKIAVNKKICENLEAQAQALFKHWFVDFAPFKDGKFVESELGLIPEGWSLIPFSDFLTPSNERVGKVGVPEYSVTNTGIHPRSDTFNKSLSKDSSKNKLLRKNNLVFGMSREILNWGIMKEEEGGVSSAYHIYIVDTEQVNATYLGEFIKFNIKYFHDLIKPASREGQGHDRNALYNKYVYVPPKSILDDFLNIYVMLKESILSYKQESSRLATLRDTLLPKLMSGEIKVNEITL